MHTSIILLALFSVALIALMITCFVCFIRSRRKEDEEFMQQVQNTARNNQQQQQQDYLAATGHLHTSITSPQLPSSLQQQQPQQQLIQGGSEQLIVNNGNGQCSAIGDQLQGVVGAQVVAPDQSSAAYAAAYAAAAASSPYHGGQAPGGQRPTEIRSDITQQINSAIIGSSEAEFQNDFIQVFPMYQIAPMPEKNTTRYMT